MTVAAFKQIPASQPLLHDLQTVDWSQQQARAALKCLPATIVLLGVGLAIHRPSYGAVATSGAVSVAFAAFHRITRYRIMPLILVAVGMAASEWVGAMVGARSIEDRLVVAAIWGLLFGAAAAFGQEHWWLGLQWVIGLCVSAGYPTRPWPAAERVSLVLLGGAVQTVAILIIWLIRKDPLTVAPAGPPPWAHGLRWMLHEGFSPRTEGGRFAMRMSILTTLSVLISHVIHMHSSYWIPMTAAIVFRPHVRLTLTRGLARFSGTLGGALVATMIAAVFRPGPVALSVLVIIIMWLAITLQRVNYGMFAMGITCYVVFLLSMVGLPEPKLALWRTVATLIGGLLALAAHASMPGIGTRQHPRVVP